MTLFLSVFLLLKTPALTNELSLNEVRALYKRSVTEVSACKKLIRLLENYDETNNQILAAYRACATMMMAKHTFNPIAKLSYFKRGKLLLERSINATNENIELHFLRFSVQSQSPTFLGYNSALLEDKTLLLKAVYTLKDISLKKIIISFLKTSDHLSKEEKKLLPSEG